MTGPSTAMDPRIAKVYSSGFGTWNERWVRSRWNPTVTPRPVSTYMTPRIARSVGDTALFHNSTIAARKAAKGRTTAATLTRFSSFVIPQVFPPPPDTCTLQDANPSVCSYHLNDKYIPHRAVARPPRRDRGCARARARRHH